MQSTVSGEGERAEVWGGLKEGKGAALVIRGREWGPWVGTGPQLLTMSPG